MTKIQWTDETINPLLGCSIKSKGCKNCYAMRMAARLEAIADAYPKQHGGRRNPHLDLYKGLTKKVNGKAVWTGKLAFAEELLAVPLSWRKPRMVFINSMSDMFHEDMPEAWIDRVFAMMALTPQHTYQVLTKRPDRMRDYLRDWPTFAANVRSAMNDQAPGWRLTDSEIVIGCNSINRGPLLNVWLGTSIEDQETADERLPALLDTPALVRWTSLEPYLEDVDLSAYLTSEEEPNSVGECIKWRPPLDWVVVGGESGPEAREHWVPSTRVIVQQCKAAGVPVFVKQMGANVRDRNDAGFEGCGPKEWHLKDEIAQVNYTPYGYTDEAQGAPCRIKLKDGHGADMDEWPEDLRVREWPRVVA